MAAGVTYTERRKLAAEALAERWRTYVASPPPLRSHGEVPVQTVDRLLPAITVPSFGEAARLIGCDKHRVAQAVNCGLFLAGRKWDRVDRLSGGSEGLK